MWPYWWHGFSLRNTDTLLDTLVHKLVCNLCVFCCIFTTWLARVGTNQLPIHLPREFPPPTLPPCVPLECRTSNATLCSPPFEDSDWLIDTVKALKTSTSSATLRLSPPSCPVHPALLSRFEDSDWLIDTLEALKALDRQLGFKALDQVAASTVARCRPSQPPQHAPHTSTHTASDPAPQSTLQGAVAGPAELANVLFLLANLNHNPGHKPILVSFCCCQPAPAHSCSQMQALPCSA